MKLIIDIPEIMLDRIKNGFPDEEDMNILIELVLNGKPLLKGHGRLIDADRLTRREILPFWYHLPNGDIACSKIDIDHAPTIIESDSEVMKCQKKCST